MSVLHVYLDNEHIGDFHQLDTGRHAFEYADDWLEADNGLPLSLSMPLDIKRYEGRAVSAFFNGLLPDNDAVRKRWGQRFNVSPNNPFALLAHMGQDCAGAIQIVVSKPTTDGKLQALSANDIATRLRDLREDAAAWQSPDDKGYFSLAGAQRKTALHFRDGRWYLPTGTLPTTHILKPPMPGFEAQEANECFCLWLASTMGLATTECETQSFGDERAIVVTRFDRYDDTDGVTRRIHMEDLCQAFGIAPTLKYQSDGGPNPERILELLEGCSDPEMDKHYFMEALFFNWLVLGTDAHAKNYSLMLGKGGQIVLAPLYDISSYVPYTDDPARTNLAMKVMTKKQAGEIRREHWQRLAKRADMNVANTMNALDSMMEGFSSAVKETEVKALSAEMNPDFIKRLSKELIDWSEQVKIFME